MSEENGLKLDHIDVMDREGDICTLLIHGDEW